MRSSARVTSRPYPQTDIRRPRNDRIARMPPIRGNWAANFRLSSHAARSELIFPIKDAASAALMLIKADCLHKAGIINEFEKQYVDFRARTFLDDAALKDVAFLNPRLLAEEHPRS